MANQELLTKVGVTAPIGTKEATEQLLAKGRQLLAVPEIDTSKSPAIQTNIGDFLALFSGLASAFQGEQAQAQTALEKMMAQTQQPVSPATKGLLSAFPSIFAQRQKLVEERPSTAALIKTTMEEMGFPIGATLQRQ